MSPSWVNLDGGSAIEGYSPRGRPATGCVGDEILISEVVDADISNYGADLDRCELLSVHSPHCTSSTSDEFIALYLTAGSIFSALLCS